MIWNDILTESQLNDPQIEKIFKKTEEYASENNIKGSGLFRNALKFNNLLRMWKRSGSPNDKSSIVNILDQAGLSDEQITQVSASAKIKLGRESVDDKIEKGTKVTTDDGETYTWLGAQWKNDKTGRIASKKITQQLNQLAKQQKTQDTNTDTDSNQQSTSKQTGVNIDLNKLAAAIKKKGLSNEVKQYLLQSLKER